MGQAAKELENQPEVQLCLSFFHKSAHPDSVGRVHVKFAWLTNVDFSQATQEIFG